jgi:hypothetical protein
MAMIDLVAQGLENRRPEARLELDREEAKEVKKFRPGQVVKVTLVGTVESMSFRKPDDPDLSGYEGHVCILMQDMDIGLSTKNAIAELLDDDE